MLLIASRWLSQPQTTATRRDSSRWRNHGGISPSWQRPQRPYGTTEKAESQIDTALPQLAPSIVPGGGNDIVARLMG
jgi:hypothetical protein